MASLQVIKFWVKMVLITSDGKYLYLASVVVEIGSGLEMAEVPVSC